MPNDRDIEAPSMFRKTWGLPQYASCLECGAVCDRDGVAVHEACHASTNKKLDALLASLDAITRLA